VPCDKYEEPSQEDIAEYEAEMQKHIERQKKVFPLIGEMQKEFKGRNGQKVVECPECGGRLHLTHAALNGHVWGQCETEGCYSWMM